jgi:hypothetical protein
MTSGVHCRSKVKLCRNRTNHRIQKDQSRHEPGTRGVKGFYQPTFTPLPTFMYTPFSNLWSAHDVRTDNEKTVGEENYSVKMSSFWQICDTTQILVRPCHTTQILVRPRREYKCNHSVSCKIQDINVQAIITAFSWNKKNFNRSQSSL